MATMTNADQLSGLRAKIAELKAMDLTKLQERTALFPARMDLEDLADTIAAEHEADVDIVLLVTRAAWTVRLDVETAGEDTPDAATFGTRVEADVRQALDALSEGRTVVGDDVIDRVLAQTVEYGKAGVKIIPVRELMDKTKCMIGNPG